MNGAIGSLAQQDIINQCYLGKTALCSAITFGPGQTITVVKAVPFNIATAIYRGVDFEAGYKLQLSEIADSLSGNLDLRFLATLSLKNYTNNGITPAVDLVGSTVYPKWKYSATITYANDPLTIVIQPRGFSSVVANNFWIECTANCPVATTQNPTINNMHLRPDFDVDTTITYKATDQLSTYLSVQNWLNRTPPPLAANVTTSDSSLSTTPEQVRGLYNATGRSFRLGVRFRM
jgi:outer membrane receptor protein involved in Fe transport